MFGHSHIQFERGAQDDSVGWKKRKTSFINFHEEEKVKVGVCVCD